MAVCTSCKSGTCYIPGGELWVDEIRLNIRGEPCRLITLDETPNLPVFVSKDDVRKSLAYPNVSHAATRDGAIWR